MGISIYAHSSIYNFHTAYNDIYIYIIYLMDGIQQGCFVMICREAILQWIG